MSRLRGATVRSATAPSSSDVAVFEVSENGGGEDGVGNSLIMPAPALLLSAGLIGWSEAGANANN